MNKKRYLFVFYIIIFCFFLTGCWNYKEIDSLYVIAGIGIDKIPDSEKYNITVELVNIKDSQSQQDQLEFESALLEIEGDSIFDAIRKIIRISSKKPYWAHATTVIISEGAARDGIIPIMDLIATNDEPRLDISVFISRGKLANEIFHTKSLSTVIRSFELSTAINENKKLMRVPVLRAYEIINELAVPKTGFVLPTITSFHNKDIDTNILSGGAVFKADKLVGFLEQEEITPYLFIKDKIKSDILIIKTEGADQNNMATLEAFDSKTKIKPIYGTDNVSFDIKIKTDVYLVELDSTTDYIGLPGRKELKKLAEKHVEKTIKEHIKNVKEKFEFDIFGFGNIIRQRNPELWKTLEDDWDSIFVDTNFNVKCDIHIKNTGHILKPVRAVD